MVSLGRKIGSLARLAAVGLALFSGASAAGQELREGPELEVRPALADHVLRAIDWPLAERRWDLIIHAVFDHPGSDPEILKEVSDQLKDPDLPAEFSHGGVATKAVLRDLFSAAHTDPKIALWLMTVTDLFIGPDSRVATEFKNLVPPGPELADFLKCGLFTLKGDANRQYPIHRDKTVFEFTHPPFSDESQVRAWVDGAHAALGLRPQAVASATLNPHFHLSRDFEKAPTDNEAKALVAELRLLTALYTVGETEEAERVRPPKPFYGGKNSANMSWGKYEEEPDPLLRGNVRLVRSHARYDYSEGPSVQLRIDGSAEVRFEVRSLGNLSWEKAFAFLQDLEGALRVPGFEEVRRSVRRLIVREFTRIDTQKLASAIDHSMESNDERELPEAKRTEHSPLDYLALTEKTLRQSLRESFGDRGDALYAGRWTETAQRSAYRHEIEGCLLGSLGAAIRR